MDGQKFFLAEDTEAVKERERQVSQRMTVLHRVGGHWYPTEVAKIRALLTPNGQEHKVVDYRPRSHPGYLVVAGHITKEEIKNAIGECADFNIIRVTGTSEKALPFDPMFPFELRPSNI